MPKNFCPAPFKNLVQDYQGRCGPCPYASGGFRFEDLPIAERWQGQDARQLRAEFLAGEKPSYCQRCWDEEQAGMKSRRKVELEFAPHFWDQMQVNNWEKGPRIMVLRLSNICNYACRTCHAIDTSKYDQEGRYYADIYGDEGNRYIANDPRREFSPEEMLEEYKLTTNLRRLEFFGGEPMINSTHEVLLKKIIDDGRAKDVVLFYNTNVSAEPSQERKKLWKQFRGLILNFSLDGINDYFHYIRWPGDWKETKARALRFQNELGKELGIEVFCSVNITVSSLNIFYLDQIVAELESIIDKETGITIVHEPPWYNPQNLPDEIKKVITTRLTRPDLNGKLDSYVAFMNQKAMDEKIFREFIRWTIKKDRYRKVRFQDFLPEYFEFLRPWFEQESATLTP